MRKAQDREEKRAQADGRLNGSNLFWSWYVPRNFGDWVTPYLYERLTGAEAVHCPTRHLKPGARTVFGAGSILRHVTVPDVAVIWGSGIIDRADWFERPQQTLAVRGPLSRARMQELGYECPEAYGDPAVALPLVFKPEVEKQDEIGLIPHFVELEDLRRRELPQGWRLIDATQDVEDVIRAICACRRTVSSSLHGMIASHAYGVPSAWVESERPLHGDGVKFQDYFASAGIDVPVAPGLWSTLWSKGPDALEFRLPELGDLQRSIMACCPFRAEAVALT